MDGTLNKIVTCMIFTMGRPQDHPLGKLYGLLHCILKNLLVY